MLRLRYTSVTALCSRPSLILQSSAVSINKPAGPVYSIQAGKLEVAPRNQRRSWKLETPYELGAGKINSTDFRPAASCDIRPAHWNIKTRRKLEIRRRENSEQKLGEAANCIQKTFSQIFDFRAIFMYNYIVKRKELENGKMLCHCLGAGKF